MVPVAKAELSGSMGKSQRSSPAMVSTGFHVQGQVRSAEVHYSLLKGRIDMGHVMIASLPDLSCSTSQERASMPH